MSARRALRKGARLDGGYRVIERLARGATLDVWDAWSEERDCRVILKALRPVHLDLKPSNVVAETGRAKVIDLGFARPPGRVRPGVGKWCYMSPEQARGGTVGPPADVWGIAAILHEALAGEATFDRLDGDGFEVPYPQLARRAEPLRGLRRVAPGVADAIDACLDPDPADRPSVGELAAALSLRVTTT